MQLEVPGTILRTSCHPVTCTLAPGIVYLLFVLVLSGLTYSEVCVETEHFVSDLTGLLFRLSADVTYL